MRKKIDVMLCICFLIGMVLGCGAKENNISEDSNAATVEESGEPETDDAAVLGNDQTPVTEESADEIVSPEATNWQQAYLAKAEEIETKYGFPMEYDLIYLDGDDIPELVAGPTGYWFILYTWKDGELYELMQEGYGTHGRIYCYEPFQGIIEESVYDMITEGKENLPEIYGRFDLGALRYLLENADDFAVHSSGYGNMAGEAVRSLLVTETDYDGEGAVTSQSQIKYEYDSDGNQIRVLLGHEDRLWTYKYDDSGNLIEEVSYKNGVIISHEKYEYDEDGRKIKSLACFGERSKTVSVYQYNDYGNLTMESTYSYYGEKVNKIGCLYEYDRGGNLIRRTFSKEDVFNGAEEYMYDTSGNLANEASYDEEGNTLWINGFDYDENGNMIKETTLSYIKKCEYDKLNNKTKEIYYLTDGGIAYYVEWTYEWL